MTHPTSPKSAPEWSAADYGQAITGSGAEKLAASRVAPLVAMAAGMAAITEGDPDGRGKLARVGVGIPSGQSKLAGWMRMGTAGGDGLAIPWYSVSSVLEANNRRDRGVRPQADTVQLRPAEPVPGKKGKKLKYVGLPDAPTVIATHPSVPLSWVDDPKAAVVITEGAMKGLSILTAVLYQARVSEKTLALTGPEANGDHQAAQDRLHTLMEGVPAQHRVWPITLVGVGTWHNHPEWNSISVRDRPVFLGFDADAGTNRDVHREAKRLFGFITHKKGKPALLRPVLEGDEKAGADDFLDEHDLDLDALLETAVTELPTPPAPEHSDGDIRMDMSAGQYETYTVPGDSDRGYWVHGGDIAVKLAAIRERYTATTEHVLAGEMPKPSTEYHGGVRLEASWLDANSAVCKDVIDGPGHLLDLMPLQWHKEVKTTPGGYFPVRLGAQEDWPPMAPEFVKAVKRTDAKERGTVHTYMHSGFAPAPDGTMAYILGGDAIDADGYTSKVASGLPELLPNSYAQFGLHPTTDQGSGRGVDREPVADDIWETLNVYLMTWTNSAATAAVLAAAFRAASPLRSESVLNFVGPPKAAKSWTAQCTRHFIRANVRLFTDTKISSTAGDTKYALEQKVSYQVLHVADDLAPQADKNKATRQAAALGATVRNLFNGGADDRGTGGGGMQKSYPPRATLVIASENPLDVASENDRLTMLRFSPKTELTDDGFIAMGKLWRESLAPARMFTAAVQMMLDEGRRHPGGWAGFTAELAAEKEGLKKRAREILMANGTSNPEERDLGKAADLGVGLKVIERLIEHVGLDDDPYLAEGLDPLYPALVLHIQGQQEQAADSKLGRALILALRSALRSGQCHVAAPASGMPPMEREDKEPAESLRRKALQNQLLGWSLADPIDPRPRGPEVGRLVSHKEAGLCVLVDPGTLPGIVLREGSGLPHGTKVSGSLTAAEAEGLTATSMGWPANKGRHRKMIAGAWLTGVAVPLDILLGTLESDPDNQDEDESSKPLNRTAPEATP